MDSESLKLEMNANKQTRNFYKYVAASFGAVALVMATVIFLGSLDVGKWTANTIYQNDKSFESLYDSWLIRNALVDSLDDEERTPETLQPYHVLTSHTRIQLTTIMTPTGALKEAVNNLSYDLADVSGALARHGHVERNWNDVQDAIKKAETSYEVYRHQVDRYLGSPILQVWGALY